MDFQLNEEQRAIRDLAREFAQNEIAKVAAHYDETGEFPYETIKKIGRLGFLGIELDGAKNEETRGTLRDVGSSPSRVRILVIPTDEEGVFADETAIVRRQDSSESCGTNSRT